jgi:phage shock protein PspC (stress-responsive transcriptional regulator)
MLATLFAIHLGFVFVVFMAVLAYLLAALVLSGGSETV